MMRQINLRVSEELLARIERARGRVPRESWLRWAVEQALGEVKEPPTREPSDSGLRTPGGDRSAAPAEQPVDGSLGARVRAAARLDDVPYRSSSFAKRDVRPVPKGGG